MKRRGFLLTAGALLGATLSARAQPPPRVARLGVLRQASAESWPASLKVLTEALGVLGWKVGQNLLIEARHANLQVADLPRLAAELMRTNPDVVLCPGPGPAMAMKQLGLATPVVFTVIAIPVGLGLAQSLGRPGGNFTGLASADPDLILFKQIELMREVLPRATRIGLLIHPENPTHVLLREFAAQAVAKLKLKSIVVEARAKDGLAPAFVEAVKQKAEFMVVGGDSLFNAERALLAELALQHRLPSMFPFAQHVEAGGLMSYGTDIAAQFRQAASYIDKILKGAHPRDLPIEEPSKYELVINMKTAKALGVAIPQTLLLRADRVIE